jgi:signal transduction histidine kinase
MLSTSIAITVMFGTLGWVIQNQFVATADQTIEDEVSASFQANESLWKARADELSSISLVLSRMPDIRAAFGTRDAATIDDTARDVWGKLGKSGTLFVVADPTGRLIAQVGSAKPLPALSFVPAAAAKFPDQARGFVTLGDQLYQVVLTPVYVATGQNPALLNVLMVGIAVDPEHVTELKQATGGSEFVFLSGNRIVASTLTVDSVAPFLKLRRGELSLNGVEYYAVPFPLTDIQGESVGNLAILRSFENAREQIAAIRKRLIALWIGAIVAGLIVTYWLTRRVLRPVADLSVAAAEIGRGNWRVQVPVEGSGEIASLAASFNTMSDNLSKAREELIRQERITTIARLSTSIIHDLRNPLAAIYGGAEMLVDRKLSDDQIRRLSANIYDASRRVQDMLLELADVSQGRGNIREVCRLREVVQAACEPLAATAEASRVNVRIDVAEDMELPLDRSPMERVFQNLIGNAIEAMPDGGTVSVRAQVSDKSVTVLVEDTGPGIPAGIAADLFQPFVTAGKRNGIGLGLALSRKTVQLHGGDLSAESVSKGACFRLRLPT